MIRYRNGAYEVVVHVGPDAMSGKPRRVSRTLRMPEGKRTPRAVLDLEARLRAEVRAGQHGTGSETVSELLDRHLSLTASGLSPSTVAGYRMYAERHLKPAFGDVKVSRLTLGDLDRCYARMIATGRAPRSVRQVNSILRRALRRAEREGTIQRNVAALVELPGESNPRPVRACTEQEVELLLERANDDAGDLIALASMTGLRRGEMCGLRWADVDLEEGDAVIQRAILDVKGSLSVRMPKNGKIRRIGIGPRLIARLADRRERMQRRAAAFSTILSVDAYVLSDEVDGLKPLSPNVASDRFKAVAKRAGIDAHLHMLRHFAASHALANGADVNAVAEHLGHTSPKMTLDVYGHAMPKGRSRVAAALDF